MPKPAREVSGVACLLLGCLLLQAQPYTRLACRHITPQSGLSDAYVRKVVRDPFGYIWVATDDGLNRFDGKNFVVYNKGLSGGHGIAGSDTWDLALDTGRGLLWVISSFGGIDAIDYRTGLVIYRYAQMDHKATADLRFTSLALDGARLFAASTSGLFVLEGDPRVRSPSLSLVQETTPNIDHLLVDRSGHLWLFCRGGSVVLLDKATLAVQAVLGSDPPGTPRRSILQFYDCDLLQDNRVLAATSIGLRLFSFDAGKRLRCDYDPFPALPQTQGFDIYSCRQDAKGATWFSKAGGLLRIDPADGSCTDIRENMSRDDHHWLEAAFDIYFDQHDDLWLGCQQGLLYAENVPAAFTAYGKSATSDVSIRHSYYLFPASDSIVYCAAQDGLYRVNITTGATFSLDNKPYYHVMVDPFGRLLASNPAGIFIFEDRRWRPIADIYPEFRNLPKLITNSHLLIGDSLLLFGTHNERGVLGWNFRQRRVFLIDRSSPGLYLKENVVTNICRDARGMVWVLGFNSVTILDLLRGKMRSLNTHNLSLKKNYSIFFDFARLGGSYYLASYGAGILQLDDNYRIVREISTADGLSSNSVYRLLPFRDSLLFVTSNSGLSVIDPRHLNRVKKYYAGDGLHSDNFEEYSGSARNGILYAGGSDGFTRIDPSLLRDRPQPSPLLPRQVEIQTTAGLVDTSNVRLSSLEVPDNALQTTISFSAFSYFNPDRPSFSYHIRELKGGWIDIGKRDFINFIGQNPGVYTLEVRTAGEDGVWSPQPLQLVLTFLPKWYQTLWFKLLILLAIILFFYSLYRYRLSQIRQQQLIRQTISSDLHDDIGSILNTIHIFTHLAKKSETAHFLTQIEQSLAQATIALRDMIWILDDTFDSVHELLERIRQFAAPIADARRIALVIDADPELYDLSLRKAEKRNLLLVAKESVNNSIKYAGCTCIHIRFIDHSGNLRMEIEDNGAGFHPQTAQNGNGLKNMAQRAAQIRYALDILSEPGAGTKIILQKL